MTRRYEPDFIKAIQKGMCNALSDTFYFTEDRSSKLTAESIVTVNIAQSLCALGPVLGDLSDIRIQVEATTQLFATTCVPFFNRGPTAESIRGKGIFRDKLNAQRNGKIDIAVFRHEAGMLGGAICAIEAKRFAPPKCEVIDDLKRNSEYLLLQGRTGAAQVEFTALCAYRDFKATRYKSKVQRDLDHAKKSYEQYVKLSSLDSSIACNVISFTASQELLDDSVTQEEHDNMSIHHHVGVIVVLRRSIA